MPKQITLSDILQEYGGRYISQNRTTKEQRSLIHLLSVCRTGVLGAISKNATIAVIQGNLITPAATATALRASKKKRWSGSVNA